MGIGASREMRPVGWPNQYSSATISPSTSSRLPRKQSSSPNRRCLFIALSLGGVLAAGQEDHFGDQQHEEQERQVGWREGAAELEGHRAGAREAYQGAAAVGAEDVEHRRRRAAAEGQNGGRSQPGRRTQR